MPEEAADHDDRKLGLQPQQTAIGARASTAARTSAVKAMPISSGMQPARGALDENVVDEDLGESGGDDRRHDQREADDARAGRRRSSRSAVRAAAAAGPAACCPTFWNAGGRLEGQHDARERLVELDHVDPPRGPIAGSLRWTSPPSIAFQHHEMVEVPVDDAGHRQLVQRRAAPCLKPLASRPKVRAALTMLLALLPSRETPQATRSCSSGIQAPWWARTMASAAAPHSTASICRMVGVRLTFLVQNSLRNRCQSDGGRTGGGIMLRRRGVIHQFRSSA